MSNSSKNEHRYNHIIEALTPEECKEKLVEWLTDQAKVLNMQRSHAKDKRVKKMLRERVDTYNEIAFFMQRIEIKQRKYTDIKQRLGVDSEEEVE